MDKSNTARSSVRRYGMLKKLILPFILLVVISLSTFLNQKEKESTPEYARASFELLDEKEVRLGSFPIILPTVKWGFALDTFEVADGVIKANQFFADVLLAHQVDYPTIEKLVTNSKPDFDVSKWRTGKTYSFLSRSGEDKPDYLVYEPSVFEYYLFDLKTGSFRKEVYPVATEIKTGAGAIESSLWDAMVGNGMSFELADKMEDALQWSIDFHHTQKNDQFKLLYEEKSIDGKAVGIGKLYAAWYKTGETEFHAIYFDSEKQPGYYDLEGRPMNKGFLKAPVKYARISSRYNMTRFHPILKRVRPHLGTDYAAPAGTPILAVGNGVVIEASYSRGNGNYVKIRHDKTYQTQYLHMSRFAKGIRSGAQVSQGQVIGYVGSTGLATGPHVCFRFWKNGKQVNHLKLTFPPPAPLPKEEMPAFIDLRDKYLQQLNDVERDDQEAVSGESVILSDEKGIPGNP